MSALRLPLRAAADDLDAKVDGEVRFDPGTRATYSTDASNFRQVPLGVVVPRTVEAAALAVDVCREHDLPVVARGGGTSLAGQCTNAAVVLDFSKYCHRLVSVDPEARRCVVEQHGSLWMTSTDSSRRRGCGSVPSPPLARTAPWGE